MVRLAVLCLLVGSLETARATPTGTGPTVDSAAAAEQEVEHALLSNNADAVGRLLAEDWIVVSTYGGVGDRDGFLEVIRNGSFSRKTM